MSNISKMFNLQDKVAALTGGAGVLAGEMAKGFLRAGCKVILLDINEINLDQKVKELSKINGHVSGFKCNVLDENNLLDVKKQIFDKHGRLEILVNAAGGNMEGSTINSS